MDALIERVRNEPVLVTALVSAILGLLIAFGLDLSDEQVGSIMALTGTLLAFVARRKVKPTRNL
jgi:ABC-type transporter Mla maintaining outer membrane lipid asymmetry permease subunit MlaE